MLTTANALPAGLPSTSYPLIHSGARGELCRDNKKAGDEQSHHLPRGGWCYDTVEPTFIVPGAPATVQTQKAGLPTVGAALKTTSPTLW